MNDQNAQNQIGPSPMNGTYGNRPTLDTPPPNHTKTAALAVLDQYFKPGHAFEHDEHVRADVALRYLEMLEKFRR